MLSIVGMKFAGIFWGMPKFVGIFFFFFFFFFFAGG